MTFAFDFRTRAVAPPLDRLVEVLWSARGTVPYERERIAPTGSTVAVFVFGDAIAQTPRNGQGETYVATRAWVTGPHETPVVNAPQGETHAVGIVTTPVGCGALFGVSPAQLHGRAMSLEEVWAPAAALRDELAAIDDPDERLRVLELRLRSLAGSAVPGQARCARAVALLEAEPTRAIADIADEVGVSHGHLNREFTRIVGMSPRSLAGLLRMRRLLASIDPTQPQAWAEHAARWGWFDQAHLNRDFKRHTGVTPTAYLAAQHAWFDGMPHVPGFVPDGERDPS